MKHNFLFSLLFAFAFVAGSIAAQTSTGDYASKVTFFPFVRIVIDFLKCPGNLPAPL